MDRIYVNFCDPWPKSRDAKHRLTSPNFLRSYGGWKTLLVVLIDMGKTVLACLVGRYMFEGLGYGLEGAMLAAVAVSLGHDFPALLGFRGGKGILCGFTVALVLDWRVALILLVFWFIMVAILWRCPYCNKRLPGLPSKDVEVCKHCGRDLTEED